jgi:hypothetical protein
MRHDGARHRYDRDSRGMRQHDQDHYRHHPRRNTKARDNRGNERQADRDERERTTCAALDAPTHPEGTCTQNGVTYVIVNQGDPAKLSTLTVVAHSWRTAGDA